MKAQLALFALSALACVHAVRLPECPNRTQCASRDPKYTNEGWLEKDYLVEGAKMSVSMRGGAVRWACAGLDPTTRYHPAPRFSPTFIADAIELIDCDVPLTSSYMDLFPLLNVSGINVKSLSISLSTTQLRNSHWPSTDHLKQFKKIYRRKNKNWLIAAAADSPNNTLESLTLRGIPMTTEQLISIYKIKDLTLVDTGLEEVMDLSEFSNLYRLELREPNLLNAEQLVSAPALQELVLHAPDAGLAAMPQLGNATFIEVYIMGSLFGKCQNLKHLALEGGELAMIPELWLKGCSVLKTLKITRLVNLAQLPSDLLAYSLELRRLDLSHNSLETLPEGLFGNTRRLEYLDVSDNHLASLPGDLPSLLKIYACGNNRNPLKLHFRQTNYVTLVIKCASTYYTTQ